MALSDAPLLKNVPSNRRRSTTPGTNRRWSDSQKIEAVTTYLALGNLALTASVLKIPEMTLRAWKPTSWWKEIEEDLRVQDDLQLSTRLQRIIETTLSATEDRLKNGDWIYNNKTGSLARKPPNLKDVHKVTMDMVDKRQAILNKQPNSVPLEQIESKLMKLAEKFAQIASGVRVLETPLEVEFTEVNEVADMSAIDEVIDPESPGKDNDDYYEDGAPL